MNWCSATVTQTVPWWTFMESLVRIGAQMQAGLLPGRLWMHATKERVHVYMLSKKRKVSTFVITTIPQFELKWMYYSPPLSALFRDYWSVISMATQLVETLKFVLGKYWRQKSLLEAVIQFSENDWQDKHNTFLKSCVKNCKYYRK